MSLSKYLYLTGLVFIMTSCTNSNKSADEADKVTETTPAIEVSDDSAKVTSDNTATAEATSEEQIQPAIPETAPAADENPEVEDIIENATAKKSYLILQSTTSYSAAMNTAKKASEQLGAKLDLRGYVFDFKEGLRATEACGCGEIHGYTARGRYDDGNYVSIEHSSGINGFTEGLYIVVAGSGDRNTLKPLQKKAQAYYKDAYIKDAEVYMGCMH